MKKLFFMLISFLIYNSINSQVRSNLGWKSHDTKNYIIEFPVDWQIDTSGQMGSSFILFSPVVGPDDHFSENVNLFIEDVSQANIDLTQYIEISKNQIKSLITDSKILESNQRLKGNLNYNKMVFTGRQGDFDLLFEQLSWIFKGKAYVLTFTAEESQFSDYILVGEAILNSFEFYID